MLKISVTAPLVGLCLLVCLGGLSGCSSVTSPVAAKADVETGLRVSPNDQRDYRTVTLENGIDVVLVSDPSADKAAAALSVGVGLLKDPMSQQGMAHYLEHMLFLGTERFPEANGYTEFMTQNGGTHNAYTWLDITNYMFKVNADAYDEALDRFSDFFKAPLLTKEYAHKEANAVNAEWSMRREMDFFNLYKIDRSMLGSHPANRFLIGNLETLSDKPDSKLHEELLAFYQRYYSANLMKVAMVSKLPLDEMERLARAHFGSIPNKQLAKPETTESIDLDSVGGQLIHYVPLEDKKQLKISFVVPNYSDQFALKPATFIAHLLGSEMPGTPTEVLRNKGWLNSLMTSSTPDLYGNYGLISIDVGLTDEGMKHRETIVGVLFNYLDKLRSQGVDERYFEELKTALENEFRFLEQEEAFSYVSSLTDSMQKYPLVHVIDAPYYYQRFDAEAINELLAQLTPAHARIWYISQQEPTDSQLHFYNGRYQIDTLGQDTIAKWQQQAQPIVVALPEVNRLLPEKFDIRTAGMDASAPTLWIDEPGLQLWHQPSELFAAQPKGLVKFQLNSDKLLSDPEAAVMLALWADLYNLQQSALLTEASVAGMQAGLEPDQGLVLSISGFTDKQPQLLQRLVDGFSQVEVSEARLRPVVDRYTRALANQALQFPFRQLFPNMTRLVRAPNWEPAQLISIANQVTAAQLSDYIEQFMQRNAIRVFAFGNYSAEDLQAFKHALVAALPETHQPIGFTAPQTWLPQPGEKLVVQRDLQVADVALLDLYISDSASEAEYAAARVLAQHLRMRTFDVLRTEEQLAYAVGALSLQLGDHAAVGFYIQTPVKDPAAMATRFDQFKHSYAEQLSGLSEQTFDELKQAVLISLTEQPKNLAEEMAPLLDDWRKQRFGFDSKRKQIAAVEKVTLAEVVALYQRLVLAQQGARALVQLRGSKFSEQPFAVLEGATVVDDVSEFHRHMRTQ